MRKRSILGCLVTSAAIAAVLAAFLALIACGSSGNTFTSPSPAVSKCAVSFDAPGSTFPASGGTAAITVKTERECQWTAQPDVGSGWLTITAGASGQGDGTVQFSAAANTDPVARNGGIMVNGQRAQVSQAAAECRFTLSDTGASLPQAGGSGRVDVRASSSLCTWTAASDVDWVTITSGANGRGSAPVSFNVAPTTGPPRAGTLTIAGSHFSVTQAEGCTYAIAPATFSAGAGGGSSVVTVTAGIGCPWTAASNVPWSTITAGATGSGPGTVTFSVAPTDGPSRTGTLTVGGQVFTVTQSPGCGFDVSPLNITPDASGGPRVLNVSTAAGCAWGAASNAPWLTITSGPTGSGPGPVNFTVAPTDGPSRTGTLTVAGKTITVAQGAGCSIGVSPLNHTADAGGGTRSVSIAAGVGCPWEARSNASWLTITSAASGTGAGTVTFTVAATNGPARSGTLTVGGQTVTVTQGEGCTFAISPEAQSVPASGGTGNVSVTAGGGCGWTAKSNDQWLTITAGETGTGNGTVSFRAAATTGPGRSGTLTIAEHTFTVTQGQGCTFALTSSSASAPAGGGTGAFDMRSADGCAWRAESNAPTWLTVTAGATGTGNATIQYSVAPNTGPQRSGVITAGGQTFTVTQAGGCTFSISPNNQNVGGSGGTVTVSVTAPGGCSWQATSNATWIGFASANSGSGNGTVQLTIAANTDGERTGTVTIAGQTFTVVQAGGCTFSITPQNQNLPAGGGTGSFSVNTAGGCAWTANVNGNTPWISITSPASNAGPASVQFSVAANTGPARTGTITAAGQNFTVTQDGGCSATVSPETINAPAGATSQNVSVTTPPECSWNAQSPTPWIGITIGAAGTGNGTSQLDIQANTGPARTGTATVAGRTVTVNQANGCAITISPQSQVFPVGGGSGAVNVDGSGGCEWTAVSNAIWIRITEGDRGSGGGNVKFTVDANATGAPRTGTISIGNQTFTVQQAATE